MNLGENVLFSIQSCIMYFKKQFKNIWSVPIFFKEKKNPLLWILVIPFNSCISLFSILSLWLSHNRAIRIFFWGDWMWLVALPTCYHLFLLVVQFLGFHPHGDFLLLLMHPFSFPFPLECCSTSLLPPCRKTNHYSAPYHDNCSSELMKIHVGLYGLWSFRSYTTYLL